MRLRRPRTASVELAERVRALELAWAEMARHRSRGSTAARIITSLARYPIVDAAFVRDTLAVDIRRASEALEMLTAVGVLRRLGNQARNRRYEAVALFDLVGTFEQDVTTGQFAR